MPIDQLVETYGLLGVFLVIFISHAIPFSYLPGWYYLIIYASTIGDNTPLKVLSIVSAALAASLAKVAVYYMGRGFRHVLSEKTKKGMELFNRIASRSMVLAIFVFAALPLPDDILYIPLGIMGYDIKRYLAAVFLGKLILATLFVAYTDIVSSMIRTTNYDVNAVVATVIATVIISVMVIRTRWFDVVETFVSKGWKRGMLALLREVFRALIPIRRGQD